MFGEQSVTGFVLLLFGGLSVVRPDVVLGFRVWIAKKLFGATYRPTQKTAQVQKILGVAFVLLGIMILTGIIG